MSFIGKALSALSKHSTQVAKRQAVYKDKVGRFGMGSRKNYRRIMRKGRFG